MTTMLIIHLIVNGKRGKNKIQMKQVHSTIAQ